MSSDEISTVNSYMKKYEEQWSRLVQLNKTFINFFCYLSLSSSCKFLGNIETHFAISQSNI